MHIYQYANDQIEEVDIIPKIDVIEYETISSRYWQNPIWISIPPKQKCNNINLFENHKQETSI